MRAETRWWVVHRSHLTAAAVALLIYLVLEASLGARVASVLTAVAIVCLLAPWVRVGHSAGHHDRNRAPTMELADLAAMWERETEVYQ